MAKKFVIAAVFVGYFLAGPCLNAATLATFPFPAVSSGSDNLDEAAILGVPIGSPVFLWPIPQIKWGQTGAVAIDVSVDSNDGDTGEPVLYTLTLNALNVTTDYWTGFEVALAGPGTFSLVDPVVISRPEASAPILSETELVFSGLEWPEPQGNVITGANIRFGLLVTPPVAGEPITITLTPIGVPEPGTGAMLIASALLARRRRSSTA